MLPQGGHTYRSVCFHLLPAYMPFVLPRAETINTMARGGASLMRMAHIPGNAGDKGHEGAERKSDGEEGRECEKKNSSGAVSASRCPCRHDRIRTWISANISFRQ